MLPPTSAPQVSPQELVDVSLLAPVCEGDEVASIQGVPRQACEGDVNCTLITSNPGATIVSPLLLSLTGVTGQIWALCILYGSHRRHNSHTVFYLLLCTLIWTDFLGKMFTTTPAIISYAYGHWVGGKEMCLYHGFTMILVQTITHFTVAAMSVERLLGICHGYLYERYVTFSRCWYVLSGIWVFSLAFCLLPLFGVGQLFLQYPYSWCYVNLHLCPTTPLRHRFFTTGLGVLTVSSLLTLVICNVVVVGSLLRMRLSRRIPAHLAAARRPSVQRDQELQMVVVLLVITVAFVVSWVPLNLILVTNQFWSPHTTPKDHLPELVAIRLASFSQILDPWVYIICRVLFKSKTWRCWRRVLEGRRWSSRRKGTLSFKMKHSSSEHEGVASHHYSGLPDHDGDSSQTNGVSQPLTTPAWTPDPPPVMAQDSSGSLMPAPSLHKHYYSDSGTGSYSGGDAPLLERCEEKALPPGALWNPHNSAVHHSLARSMSVAIPIPLFTCEQYRVSNSSKTEASPCYLLPVPPPGDSEVPRVRSCVLEHHQHLLLGTSLLPVHGVPRSHSWGCPRGHAAQPEHRSCSTQTLHAHHSSSSIADTQGVQ